MSPYSQAMALAALLLPAAVVAQDARVVKEPAIPPACVRLAAHLTAVNDGTYNKLAPEDERKLDTERIQKAIDSCGAGKAVVLEAQGPANAFVSGALDLRAGVTLVVAQGTTLFETLDPKVLEISPGSCGVVSAGPGRGCKPLITVSHVTGVGIMGEGVIDGRGGEPILGTTTSAWDLAQAALKDGGGQKVSRLIVADHADDFTLYRITLRNSPNFHVSYNAGDGFTVWGVKIDTVHRIANAVHPLSRNTDGIDPGNGSKNITVTQSYFREGDDNIAIKGGPGGVTNMSVIHNHFYWGHGMSIGSETNGGVSRIRVSDLTLDGTDSGIRIKSTGARGGLVHDVVYDDICIRNSGRPLDITAAYAANGPVKGDSPPTFRDITLRNVSISGGGQILFDGYDHDHRAQLNLDGVYLTDAADSAHPYTYTFDHADIVFGLGGSNLQLPAGNDATVTHVAGEGAPAAGPQVQRPAPSCAERFVPFPAS
ncbi:polygalacturonase [Bryocella elongata]|uniref:Polygalacturonase n=1 Tax=Bryocella elongata TaxID=863522 RepID=A0A1H5VTB1_9BACT|nr:glycosyl hydrolase family 28 protein [Bryocella elongata]SEF90208.1 polygalacturonase [Bryocella elongata]